MKTIGIVYGSSGGNTEGICKQIAKELGEEHTQLLDIAKTSKEEILNFENLILASATYGSGDLQDDWEKGLNQFEASDFASKVIALVGVGDQDTYSDTFCESLYHLYEKVKLGKVIGKTPIDSYEFDSSLAVVEGEFVGLALDEDNQAELTEPRIKKWVEVIRPLFA